MRRSLCYVTRVVVAIALIVPLAVAVVLMAVGVPLTLAGSMLAAGVGAAGKWADETIR